MAKKRKMKMEFRYYQMQDGIPFWHFLVKSGCRIMEGMWITFTFITIWRSVSATVAKESWC